MAGVPKARSKPKYAPRSRTMRRLKSAAIWLVVLAAIGGLIYGLANTSGIAYGERQLPAVDFSSLNESQKETALVEANAGRCGCGCGMGLAQCVATDMTCPIRTDNITKIRALVQKARNSGGGS
jgi:hypothetical protein